MQRAVEGGQPVPSTAGWTDLVVAYLHHESLVHSGKMHFPTVGKFMAHGQWRSDVPDKAYVLRSSFLSSPRSRCFPPPLTHAVPIISILCLGKRVAQCVTTSQFERTAPACRPKANLQGSLSVIIPDESSEVNAFDERASV